MAQDKETYERLARLEALLPDQAARDIELSERIEELDAKLDDLLQEVSRYRGWAGGALWVAGALVAAVKLFGLSLLGKDT